MTDTRPGSTVLADIPAAALDWVERVHAVVDELVAPIAQVHGERLRCREGCSGCCADELTVFELEAAVIVRHHAALLAEGIPNDRGGCAFLGAQGECRVYEQRPYVCRTQGLPLRWLETDEHGEAIEVRDLCPLNAEGPALEELSEDACWSLGPIEQRLAARQSSLDGGVGRRVPLRSLFARGGEGSRRLPVLR